MSMRPRRFEVITSGFDENLSLVGGDPFGGSTSVGLRVPFLATPLLDANGGQLRYLFLLASFSVPEGACVRIRGFRQLLTIGLAQTKSGAKRVIEFPVTTPFWHFNDGDVSWHIRMLGEPNAASYPKGQTSLLDSNSFKQYWADAPALLYGPGPVATVVANGGVYTSVTSYCPPNGGKPYGESLTSDHGTFYDVRSPWNGTRAWDSLDVPIRGPETVAFFASIRQTSPSRQLAITPPGGTFYSEGLTPEDQFLLNFPATTDPVAGPTYWRVGGSLIVEEA